MTARPIRTAAGIAASALLLAACGTNASQPITVSAAASLTETFTQLAEQFEAASPGTDVRLNFAGSTTLVQQLRDGIPADAFAPADAAHMSEVADLVHDPTVFATNSLVIAVPSGNPAGIDGPEDLARENLRIVLCQEAVPCGAVGARALAAAGVTPSPDSLEGDVKAVLTKVRTGEADAGLVYRTDALAAAHDVETIEFPEADALVNEYPIAVLRSAPQPAAAQEFVDYVLSDAGQTIITGAGFGTP